MLPKIHGAKWARNKAHPVFDLRRWKKECPLSAKDVASTEDVEGTEFIASPQSLALREQAVSRAERRGALGPSVPADLFVWANLRLPKRPWLTRLGGVPWRSKREPWPRDNDGVPLVFLGQICFADSSDILPCGLPGDVALIFGKFSSPYVISFQGCVLEWSSLRISEPTDSLDVPWNGRLPFEYLGVIHRTRQYADLGAATATPVKPGGSIGNMEAHRVQATSVGSYARLPQGWPFSADDGNTLVATLSSFQFSGTWPMCDIPHGLRHIDRHGQVVAVRHDSARDFLVGDVGAFWIYRTKSADFKLDVACG